MSAAAKVRANHARQILRERNALLKAVQRLTAHLRELDERHGDVDGTEVEGCEEIARQAREQERERQRDRKIFKGVA